jgi:hypothetical protein
VNRFCRAREDPLVRLYFYQRRLAGGAFGHMGADPGNLGFFQHAIDEVQQEFSALIASQHGRSHS